MKKKPNTSKQSPEGKIISLRKYENKKENEAVRAARDYVEELIRARGGQIHTKSQIRTYKVGNEIVVRLDDVLELARVMKEKFREGIEPGYISETKEQRVSAFLALNHFQTVMLSNELSKVNHIDDHKRIIEEHSGRHKKPLIVPGRYALGCRETHGCWMFLRGIRDNTPSYTVRPCLAYRFLSYEEARNAADSMDNREWAVIDMIEYLPKDKRLMRDIFVEDGWDDGCENAVRLGDS